MKKSLSFISLLLLCLIPDHECNGRGVLEDVVLAIEKGIDFYNSSYTDMNIDGLFGLRVLEGQLALVEMHLKADSHLSDDIQKMHKRIADSYRRARKLSELALRTVNESNQHFFRLMKPVIQRPWSFGKNYRRLDPNLKWKNEISLGKVSLTEELSDKCMGELLGTQTGTPCSISDECVTVMSTRGMNGYGITHQILYTMLAEQSGCFDILNAKLLQLPSRSVSVEQLRAEFCVNNFYETSNIVLVQKGIINAQLHDLFLEQELVCAMLGYFEFLHNDWLRQIISWQMPSGCYVNLEPNKPDPLVKRRSRKDTPFNYSKEATRNIIDGRPTPVDLFVPPNKEMPQAEQKQMGNLGSINQITQFVHKDPTAAIEKLVGRHLNLRRNKFNASQIHRAVPVLVYTPMAVERGKLGGDKINPIDANLMGYGNLIKGKSKHSNNMNPDQGKVGDTRMRIKRNGAGMENRLEHKPISDENVMSDNESFDINRRINRKLLYEKVLKDGCLAHKTAVAMGALTQYLRFLIFANASNLDAMKNLFNTNYLMHPNSLFRSSDDFTSFVRPASVFPLAKPMGSQSLSKNGIGVKVNDGPAGYDRKDNFDLGNIANGLVDTKLSVNLPSKSANGSIISDVDSYEDDAAVEVPATNPPIVKSGEDELLLYDELLNMKAAAKSASKAMRQRQVTASNFQVVIDSSFEGITSISSTYGVVSIMTVVILLLLYRSLRKHRFGMQHRQSRWR